MAARPSFRSTGRAAELRTAALVVAASALAGLPVGLVWWLVAPLPPIVKRAGGLFRGGGEGNEAAIAADGWFVALALAAGIVTALVVYLCTRPGRVGPLLGLAVGGVLGAVVAWRFGALLGPGPIEATAAGLPAGSSFDGPLTVSAYGVLLGWPMAAVITYFAVAAGAESSEPRATAVAGHDSSAEPPARGDRPDAADETSAPPTSPASPAGVSPADGAEPSGPR